MSVRTKKLIGAIGIGTLIAGALISLYGAILYYVNAKADSTQLQVSGQASLITSIKQDTAYIKAYICHQEKGNCSLAQ